jgi:hypothetical protein
MRFPEHFLKQPFSTISGSVLYGTGRLLCWQYLCAESSEIVYVAFESHACAMLTDGTGLWNVRTS